MLNEIISYIEAAENNHSLHEEENFDQRQDIIDYLEFGIIDHLDELSRKADNLPLLIELKSRAEKIKANLEAIDNRLFEKLRMVIQSGLYTEEAFKKLISGYVGHNLAGENYLAEPGYDNLDLLINGLFSIQTIPEHARDLEPEMVYYQKTPAKIIFELVEKVRFTAGDVFFDLGSGLGQANLLVNILTGIKTIGVEFDPAYCNYANTCAASLNLRNVTFINVDARKADYAEGTVFFMFTPFKGGMLQEVLSALKKESLKRKIKIITYGPCTAEVALQNWLSFDGIEDGNIYRLRVFSSL